MRHGIELLSGFLALTLAACHETPESKLLASSVGGAAAQPLRLEAVRFYEMNIGYFERAGTTRGDTPLALVVPESHLDDALRTLVVLSDSRPPSVEFETVLSRELVRERGGLPEAGGLLGYKQILASLEGAEVEVEAASGVARGRLSDVSDAPPIAMPNSATNEARFVPGTIDDVYLTLVGSDAGVRHFRASELKRIRPTDPARRARLETALAGVSPDAERRERMLHASGKGGPLRLGYVAATPSWRATYRLLLPASGATATLQASALVHNDTDEAWSDVRATFASGRPSSFVTPRPGSNQEETFATLGVSRGAATRAAGSFEYRALAALSVRAHGSALVPFLNVSVDSRPLVWFNGSGVVGMRALRVSNTTAQTFPQGIVAVFGSDGFAGEATFQSLSPGGVAYLRYENELDVTLEEPKSTDSDVPVELAFDGDAIVEKRHLRSERKYVLTNRKKEPVSVHVVLGFLVVSSTQGFDGLDDDAAPTGVFEVAGGEKLERPVVIESDETVRLDLESATSAELAELLTTPALPPASSRALRAAVALADRIADNAEASETADQRANDLEGDLETARTELSDAEGVGPAAGNQIVLHLFALERKQEALQARATSLHEEGARLSDALSHELGHLPKPRPTP